MTNPTNITIIWHMHQPYYKDPVKDEYLLPWTYLHAIKDYYDMPAIVEDTPGAKAVFNLVPSLIEQILDYSSGAASDPFLQKGEASPAELSEEERIFLLENFFSCNRKRMIEPSRRYLELLYMAGEGKPGNLADRVRHFTDQDIIDLQVWFFLAWTGEAARRKFPFFGKMVEKGENYTPEEKKELFATQRELLRGIIPLYKRLHEEAKIELSVTPYYHPILPLLCDIRMAQTAMPRVPLPASQFRHPEDAKAQVKRGIEYFRSIFGFAPCGMWPSEGAVSNEAVDIIAGCGIRWIATDEEILARSRDGGLGNNRECLYMPWLIPGRNGDVAAFFRDHQISDLIGFTYSQWDHNRATADLVGRLMAIRSGSSPDGGVIPIILDGENAWEYYPDNGYHFLSEFYKAVVAEPGLNLATCSEVISKGNFGGRLKGIHPGSWINADYGIWIGHPEENLAWDMVANARDAAAAKNSDVALILSGESAPENSDGKAEAICRSLYAAEGSDWFWWYGDDHFSPHSDRFDLLFRRHLMNVYELIGEDFPRELLEPVKKKSPAGLVREPAAFLNPDIDGRVSDYFEWLAAGLYDLTRQGSAMHSSDRTLQSFFYGYNRKSLFFRIDATAELSSLLESSDILNLHVIYDREYRLSLQAQSDEGLLQVRENGGWRAAGAGCRWKIARICEVEIPLDSIKPSPGSKMFAFVTLLRGGEESGRWPSDAPLLIYYAGAGIEFDNWLI